MYNYLLKIYTLKGIDLNLFCPIAYFSIRGTKIITYYKKTL